MEKVKAQLKLQDIYKKRQLETIKSIDTEITNYVVEHQSKELTEKLLKHWGQECKSKEARNHKISHMKETMNTEYKMKERRNLWEEQPKKKLNEKETSSDQ